MAGLDMTNTPKMSEVMKDFGFKTGALIDARFKDMDADRQLKLDSAIATLTDQDTAVMSVINKLERITDAQPGTPEHDEGVNLYTLMETNYLALDDRLTANEDLTTALNTWKTGFVTNYNAAITRIDAAVLAEQQARQADVTRLEGLIQTNNEAIAAANAARLVLKQQLEATDAIQTEEINSLKARMAAVEGSILTYGENIAQLQLQMTARQDEIAALQTQHNDLAARVLVIENLLVDVNAGDAVAEFAAGMSGQASPGGYSPYTPS